MIRRMAALFPRLPSNGLLVPASGAATVKPTVDVPALRTTRPRGDTPRNPTFGDQALVEDLTHSGPTTSR